MRFVSEVKTGERYTLNQKRIDKAIEQTSIQPFLDKKMKVLSGGMRRRVGIAQALLNDSKVIIIDEPTAGLDPEQRIEFNQVIDSIGKDRIILISTHIIEDVQHYCDKIVLIHNGKIQAEGTLQALAQKLLGKVFTLQVEKSEFLNFKANNRVLDYCETETAVIVDYYQERGMEPVLGSMLNENITIRHIWSAYR